MKLARYENEITTGWGLINSEVTAIRPISGGIGEWGGQISAGAGQEVLTFAGDALPLPSIRLLPPFEGASKVIMVGANYSKHLKDFNIEAPTSPQAFLKPARALIGAYDDISYSRLSNKFDFEVELVVVFGASISKGGNPAESILGYTVGNDMSARDLQPGIAGVGMDLLSAKGLDNTCPLGPWIVTRDEFGDSSPDLAMTTHVNGELRQDGRTGEMTWSVGELASYVNDRTSIEPGDIMFTGTPEGVAQGDGRFLSDGDVVEVAIEGIGAMKNTLRRPKS